MAAETPSRGLHTDQNPSARALQNPNARAEPVQDTVIADVTRAPIVAPPAFCASIHR
jgi:hypothetical protein